MAINKTLYVKDEDAHIWEKAKEYVGDSLSSWITAQLRNLVISKEAAEKGSQRIELKYIDKRIPKSIAFYGNWLIPPRTPFVETQGNFSKNYAVALRAKNNVLVFTFFIFDHFDGNEPKQNGFYKHGGIEIFSSFETMSQTNDIPSDLIITIMQNRGIEVEELDI